MSTNENPRPDAITKTAYPKVIPDDYTRWWSARNRDEAYALENQRNKEMREWFDIEARRAYDAWHAKIRQARTEAEKRQATEEFHTRMARLNLARQEEEQMHRDILDDISRHWDIAAPIPNRIDGRDNRLYANKIPKPRLAPNPPTRYKRGRLEMQLPDGRWVPK